MFDELKQLSQNELLSKSIIYRELEDLFTPEDSEDDIVSIINNCHHTYLEKDYATLIGVAQSAREYIEELKNKGKCLKDFNYDILFTDYHGVGYWF